MGQTGRSGTCNALSFELAEKEQSRAEVGFDERSLATASFEFADSGSTAGAACRSFPVWKCYKLRYWADATVS